MERQLRIVSRQSPLALLQVREVMSFFPGVSYTVSKLTSYGDRHREVSLMDPSLAQDFFTRELDSALLEGRADIAIHSAKDLPYPLPKGIEVIALTKGGDKSDSLVTRDGKTLSQLPSGSRIGTSSTKRKEELLAIRKDIEVVPVRGSIEERIAQVDSGAIDALIVATCALDRLGLSARASERLPFKTHPLQGNLAVTASVDAAPWIRELFSSIDIRRGFGTVTLVGFGPGDPELLTIKGEKALSKADVIFYDDLTGSLDKYSAEKIYVGKRSGKHSHDQEDINELMYRAALEGKDVVRLKGGDPMIFAHGREEIDYLASRLVKVEAVPGVSSAVAASSLTGIPLTHRGLSRSVAFVLGHGDTVQTPSADTLVYYMGGSNISNIADALIASGRSEDTAAALVSDVSLPGQKAIFSTLGELRYSVYRHTPVILMVGDTVALAAVRQKVYHTGSQSDTPLIEIHRLDTPRPDAKDFDWVVFTSRYGVKYYERSLEGVKVATVGPVTSAALGFKPDFESPTRSAEGLLDFFRGKWPSRILLPRSEIGLKSFSDGLRAEGHTVIDLPVYSNTPVANPVKVKLEEYDKVEFTSPSTVEAFKKLYGNNIPDQLLLTAKGKTTYGKLKETYI